MNDLVFKILLTSGWALFINEFLKRRELIEAYKEANRRLQISVEGSEAYKNKIAELKKEASECTFRGV